MSIIFAYVKLLPYSDSGSKHQRYSDYASFLLRGRLCHWQTGVSEERRRGVPSPQSTSSGSDDTA